MRNGQLTRAASPAGWVSPAIVPGYAIDKGFGGHHLAAAVPGDTPGANALNRRAFGVLPAVKNPYDPIIPQRELRLGDSEWEYTTGTYLCRDAAGNERRFSVLTNRIVQGELSAIPSGSMIDPLGITRSPLARLMDPLGLSRVVPALLDRASAKMKPPAGMIQVKDLESGQEWYHETRGTLSEDRHFAFTASDGSLLFSRFLPGDPPDADDDLDADASLMRFAQDYHARGGSFLSADIPGLSARLALGAVKPPLVHGDRGRYLSPVPDQTLLSIHLSWPRHVSGGWIEVDGTRYEVVTGTSWVDHQTLHLSKLMDVMEVGDKLNGLAKLKDTAVNWTWLTCNLDDGADLMLFALWDSKRDSGRVFMAGTYSSPDGHQVNLSQDDFEITPLETAPSRGVKEPKTWRLRTRVPGYGTYELNKAFHLDDNWVNINGAAVVEGATRVSGTMFVDDKSTPVNAVAAWGETVNFLGRQPE